MIWGKSSKKQSTKQNRNLNNFTEEKYINSEVCFKKLNYKVLDFFNSILDLYPNFAKPSQFGVIFILKGKQEKKKKQKHFYAYHERTCLYLSPTREG